MHNLSANVKNDDCTTPIDSGTFGNGLTWKLCPDGTLNISGNGEMPNWVSTELGRPWQSHIANITGIVIDGGITRIGNYAFYNHSAVNYKSIGSSVNAIGEWAFANCTALETVIIPDGVTNIAIRAFSGCTAMSYLSIGSGISQIRSGTFENTGLTEVTIPEGITSFIGGGAFSGSSNLETIYWNAINCGDFISTDYHFINCPLLENVVFGNSVQRIPAYGFYGIPGLKSVTMSGSITHIGNYAFGDCNGLPSVTIGSGVTNIGNRAFAGCTGLTEMVIPNNVITVSNSAFEDCTGLTSVSLGSGMTTIPDGMFRNTGLTSVTIPEGIGSIGSNAFTGSANLETVYFNAANCSNFDYVYLAFHPFYNCVGLTTVVFGDNVLRIPEAAFPSQVALQNVTIGSSVTNIARYAFTNCSNLKEVDISNSVNTIGSNAFSNCVSLNSITLGSGVTNIAASAFSGSAITELTIPEGVISIGSDAFGGSTKLETVYFNAINCGNFISIDYHFANCPLLTSVIVGDNVIRIPDYAFFGIASLTAISIGSSVNQIGSYAFANCPALATLTIPNNVNSMGISVFEGCTGLTSASIGSGLSAIPNSAFLNSGLLEITIPDGITSIGSSAFWGSSRLETIYFNARNCNDFISTNYHFQNCAALTTAIVGNNVRRIPAYAFLGTNVEIVTIGSDVRDIGNYAFANCTFLEDITNWALIPQIINANVFDGVDKRYCTLYVPEASIDEYQNTLVWKDFYMEPITSVKELLTFDIKVYPNPFIDRVYITDAAGFSLQIINFAGTVVYNQRIESANETLYLEHLPAGIFIFSFEDKGEVKVLKMVKNL